MTKEQGLGLIRHLLTFAGGFAIAKGYVTPDILPEIVGATITLIGAVWSAVDKK